MKWIRIFSVGVALILSVVFFKSGAQLTFIGALLVFSGMVFENFKNTTEGAVYSKNYFLYVIQKVTTSNQYTARLITYIGAIDVAIGALLLI